jgi:hypothetical protein
LYRKSSSSAYFLRCEILQGSTYRFEVVILHIWEVLKGTNKKQGKPKNAQRTQTTGFEKNARKLRSKERKLDAQKPIKAVSPN